MSDNTATELPIDINLFQRMAAAVILSDDQDNIVWVNDCFLRLMTTDKDSLLGAPVATILKTNLTATVSDPDVNRYETKNDRGDNLWLQSVKTPVTDKHGKNYRLRILIDITEFEHRQKIRPLITTGKSLNLFDEGTAILNRRAIFHELVAEISRTRRYGNPLSVILIRYPVTTIPKAMQGDLFQEIINTLNSHLRWVDKLGKLEDDEFLIILPESDHAAAEHTLEKVNEAIMDMTVRREQLHGDYAATVTGWVKNDSPETMLQRLHLMLAEKKVA